MFCRFIDTAEYVAEHLRARSARATGRGCHRRAAARRTEARIAELTGTHAARVLVATDCLSEGINLQEQLPAVLHYDLAWNPTRHEQREGRVDRFGQPQPDVRA